MQTGRSRLTEDGVDTDTEKSKCAFCEIGDEPSSSASGLIHVLTMPCAPDTKGVIPEPHLAYLISTIRLNLIYELAQKITGKNLDYDRAIADCMKTVFSDEYWRL